MKSYVKTLTSVYLGILRDATYAFPDLGPELVKDQQRLVTLIENRGLPFLMVDLANLGKHLDRCLSKKEYTSSGLPASRPISARVQIPMLFRGLYLLVFDQSGKLKENVDGTALFFLRQLLHGAKRAKIMCSDAATQEAFAGFHAAEDSLPVPHPWWDDEQGTISEENIFPGFARESSYVARADQAQVSHRSLATLDEVFRLLLGELGRYNPADHRFSHGTGSVSDLAPECNRYEFRSWSRMLETVYPYADTAFYSYASWMHNLLEDSDARDLSSPSKLLAVVKTLTKPRLIASEPVANMFCQQNVRRYMYKRVENSIVGEFIRFTDQTQNQRLCLSASLDGSLATIDLSEASDRVSCMCVGNVFRHQWSVLRALRACRTPYCETPDRGTVKLRKYSTMGNATTFPVQSLIFLGIALAGTLGDDGVVTIDRIKALKDKVSVFGDDIIVPTDSVGAVIKLLEVLHFKVNVHKSFYEGNFRESCGVDAFQGMNVTPVYWRTLFTGSPESYDATVATANNFYKRFLVVTSQVVQETLSGGRIRIPLVPCDSGAFGFYSFVKPRVYSRKRYNAGLQREEYFLPCLSMASEVVCPDDDTVMFQFFTELPDPLSKWKPGVKGRPVLKVQHKWVSEFQLASANRGTTYKPPKSCLDV